MGVERRWTSRGDVGKPPKRVKEKRLTEKTKTVRESGEKKTREIGVKGSVVCREGHQSLTKKGSQGNNRPTLKMHNESHTTGCGGGGSTKRRWAVESRHQGVRKKVSTKGGGRSANQWERIAWVKRTCYSWAHAEVCREGGVVGEVVPKS